MSSRARGSKRPHSVISATLCRGMAEFTKRFMGTFWRSPGATRMTLGSSPWKAERRNLNVPLPTRQSVHERIADFWSFRASSFAEVGLRAQRACKRPWSAAGLAWITTSTSGTATLKAEPFARLPAAKATTSASGSTGQTTAWTATAICATAASDSGVGAIWPRSSATSASQPTLRNVGATTGTALGARTSGFLAPGVGGAAA
mmetsp:Transcript_87930/g.273193  ORF Transcript_87930/g.273193 Transcript_87930/m.273193 type:complete len:203 (-) Transcript_87930:489-1097(-)